VYITVPGQKKTPRLTHWQLLEFLGAIQGQYRDRSSVWCTNTRWVDEVTHIAQYGSRFLQTHTSDSDDTNLLPPEIIEEALKPLKRAFSQFKVFGLAVGTYSNHPDLIAFYEHAAYSSREYGLFLIPDLPLPDETLQMFDPLPIAKSIATRPDLWPGILFWTPFGASAFAPLQRAYGLYQDILERFDRGEFNVEQLISDFNNDTEASESKRLLHLSDFHFGNEYALRNQAYLSLHLKSKIDSFHRIVVTGDLFDNPKEKDALAFRNFRVELEAATGKDLIVIPGNHDQRARGNALFGVGRELQELTKLEWSSLVIDEDIQCVFYCFDSAFAETNFARGKVTGEQMIEIATLFEAKANAKPHIRD
jgi:hypothetical protein